jgi:hypothetical protein
MYSEGKKLGLIKKILEVDEESIWITIEDVLNNASTSHATKASIYDFVGFISTKEAELMKEAISEVNSIN